MVVMVLAGALIASFVLRPPPVAEPQAAVVATPEAVATEAATISSERVGDWFLACSSDAKQNCIAQQQVADSSGSVVFTWSLQVDGEGVVRALWHMPADAQTDKGFIIDAGDGKPRPAAFSGCDAKACTVRGILAPAFLATLQASPKIVAAYVSRETGQPVRLGLSGKGMADVVSRLAERTAANP